jgi:hypothetical protein
VDGKTASQIIERIDKRSGEKFGDIGRKRKAVAVDIKLVEKV